MFSDFNVLDMRVLHFEKLLPHHEKRTEKKSLKITSESDSGRIYQKFCSLGYYDQMSYVRAKDKEEILNYKHCFLIKYPYQQSEKRMVTDQMFTLLSEGGPKEKDPFEVDESEEMPFLGIILLTLGKSQDHTKKHLVGSLYQKLVETYKSICIEILEQTMKDLNQKSCYQLFYTPNCADLCIVIRTDVLQNIYDVKEQLSTKKLDNEDDFFCYTTSYTLFQLPGKAWSDTLIQKNENLWLELRLYAPEYAVNEIKQCLTGKKGENGKVYGITGSGQYALELDFPTFASIYPQVWRIKADIGKYVGVKSELGKIFEKYDSVLECSYMRVKYQPHVSESSLSGNLNGLCLVDTELVEKYENEIIKFVKEKIKKGSYQVSSLKEQKAMLRELYI